MSEADKDRIRELEREVERLKNPPKKEEPKPKIVKKKSKR